MGWVKPCPSHVLGGWCPGVELSLVERVRTEAGPVVTWHDCALGASQGFSNLDFTYYIGWIAEVDTLVCDNGAEVPATVAVDDDGIQVSVDLRALRKDLRALPVDAAARVGLAASFGGDGLTPTASGFWTDQCGWTGIWLDGTWTGTGTLAYWPILTGGAR